MIPLFGEQIGYGIFLINYFNKLLGMAWPKNADNIIFQLSRLKQHLISLSIDPFVCNTIY